MAKDKSMTEQDLTKYVIAILEEADKGFQDACSQWETRFSRLEEKCDARFDKIEARLAEIEEHLPNLARGKDIKGTVISTDGRRLLGNLISISPPPDDLNDLPVLSLSEDRCLSKEAADVLIKFVSEDKE